MALKLNLSYAGEFACEEKILSMKQEVEKAHEMLHNGTGAGSDYLGWIDLPVNYDKEEFAQIKESAEKIKKDSEALVVLGIGGSYLGARAVIEFIKSNNYNLVKKDTPDIYYGGNTISSSAVAELIKLVEGKDFSVNVISKSGTTTETSIAFRIFKQLLEDAESDGGLGGGAGLGDDVDGEIAVADDLDNIVQIGRRDVVAGEIHLGGPGKILDAIAISLADLSRQSIGKADDKFLSTMRVARHVLPKG